MDIEFISSFAVITPEPEASGNLYRGALGLGLEGDDDGYLHSEKIDGSRHFGVWPLRAAARACFGADAWPAERPVPQASIEFELESVEAVAAAAAELEQQGYELLHGAEEQPWGQTVARLQGPEGAIVGLSFAPWTHE